MGGRELLFCRLSETGQGLGGLRGGAPPEHTSLLGLRTVTDDSFGRHCGFREALLLLQVVLRGESQVEHCPLQFRN